MRSVQAVLEGVETNKGTMDWRHRYAVRLLISDLLVLVWVVFGVQIAWLGLDSATQGLRGGSDVVISYVVISVSIIAGWMISLSSFDSRADRVIGVGSTEYKAVANASLRLFGLVAIIAFLFKIDLARGYLLIAFPVGVLVLLFSRWMWRQWLHVQRQNGQYSSKVLLVGSETSVGHIARELLSQPAAGYHVVGACVPTGRIADVIPGTSIPISGTVETVMAAVVATGADTVIITSSDELPPNRVRELSWGLEPGRQHLVVAPSLTDVGGPRIHTRPVAGLPLIHVETPRYAGGKLLTKRVFDLAGSGVLLIALLPMFAIVSLLVKASSPGPVFFRQERVGLMGRHFNMLKFRSMRSGADADLQGLLDEQGRGDQPLFKVVNDPRITAIGKVLRKYSLDEFPQLVNVFLGDMSLVGPRPQRDGEVALYDSAAHRRLLLKPGMSGLWQVSGRSNLSWEDAIRLDLYYVENWSLMGDFVILWRTIKAVFLPEGSAH